MRFYIIIRTFNICTASLRINLKLLGMSRLPCVRSNVCRIIVERVYLFSLVWFKIASVFLWLSYVTVRISVTKTLIKSP